MKCEMQICEACIYADARRHLSLHPKLEPMPSVPSRDQPMSNNAKNTAELRREDQTALCTVCTPPLQGLQGGEGMEDKRARKEKRGRKTGGM